MSQTAIEIRPVHTRSEQNQFIKFPWQIYQGDPHWVPPLIVDMKNMMNRKKCPFFEHSEAEFFMAFRNGKPVGRIAAILNNRHNDVHKEQIGFFGFFECINDREVSRALFGAATDWCRQKGLVALRGPANYSQNETCGLLIDSFDSSPVVLMTYNPPYYIDLVEDFGLQKVMDLYAYYLESAQNLPQRLIDFAEAMKKRTHITVRSIRLKDFWEEVEKVKFVYNSAWAPNWGFVPLTDKEITHLAKELRSALDPDIVFMAEDAGRPIGFSLTIPDMNQALKVANGRLFPFGLLKILRRARKIDGVRVVIMGIIPEYQKIRGIDSIFYWETFRRGTAKGYKWGEFSWILENNVMMNRAAQLMGARVYKTYRMYQMPI